MNSSSVLNYKNGFRFLFVLAILCTVSVISIRSHAATPLATVTITNNSSWEIRYLYLSAVDNDNWSGDQLNGSSISPGGTQNINVSWGQSTVKLIAEDQDGCFITTTVDISSAASWTITSGSARNCGGSN
ncbi:MAG TPA: hypothetical protein VJU86_07705 [Pyrinomonadaceae bacterium]|nr:hypothetical protein [Pyrinomonadaceae bacterium]